MHMRHIGVGVDDNLLYLIYFYQLHCFRVLHVTIDVWYAW